MEDIQEKVLCAISGCKNQRSADNRYCTRHDVHAFVDETVAAGRKVCHNVNRKCRAQLELTYLKSSCPTCLERDRTNSKMKREKAKADNELRSGEDDMACTACLKILPIDQFKKNDGTNGVTSTCLACKMGDRKQGAKRDREHNRVLKRGHDAKRRAK